MSTENKTTSKGAFDDWEKTFNKEKPSSVYITNGVPVVFITEMTKEMEDAIRQCIPMPAGMGYCMNDDMACRACRGFATKYLRWRDENGQPLFMPGKKETYPKHFWPLWEAARTGTILTAQVVAPNQFGLNEDDYHHFSVNSECKVPNSDVEKRQRIIDKYVPFLTIKFAENGVEGIHASLDAFIKTLPTVTYGGKLLDSAIWLRKHIPENFKKLTKLEQLKVCIDAIFELRYGSEVGSNDVTVPLYHQVSKNTLDALAVSGSIEELRALLKDRLSPENYQVKTAEAKDGHIEMAIKYIGDFSTKLMTLESAINHGAKEIKNANLSSAFEALSMMKSKKKAGGAAGFASRTTSDVKTLKTMKDLMENTPDNLEVYAPNQTPVHAVDFVGLKEGVYQTPFTWGFHNHASPNIFDLTGWCKVLAILPMKQNFMFICEGAKKTSSSNLGPCCHVSLLTTGYNKTCGQAFGNLSKNLKLDTSGNGPFAMGVGVSLDPKKQNDDDPPLSSSIKLRSNNTEFTIW